MPTFFHNAATIYARTSIAMCNIKRRKSIYSAKRQRYGVKSIKRCLQTSHPWDRFIFPIATGLRNEA